MDIFTESSDSEDDFIEENSNKRPQRAFRTQINFDCYKIVDGIVANLIASTNACQREVYLGSPTSLIESATRFS
uniref:Uncharacterized protein n=1 Tax=Romanomermis culicivorax TaxID=13658 RepID=A0A915IH68_ROMCU